MSPRLLYDLLIVLQLQHSGRARAAAEKLADVIREHHGCIPAAVIEAKAPVEKPLWMRGA